MMTTEPPSLAVVPQRALWLGGVAAVLSAATTFLLWYLPRTYASPAGFAEVVALHAEPAYIARLWINYIHVFVALLAYGVTAAVLRRRAPVATAVGLTAFAFWCLAEALGVSVNIWAVNDAWRAGYAAADPEMQNLIRSSLHTYSGIWNGIFFVILTAFLIGTLSYGTALASGGMIERILAALFLLAAPLTVIIMLDGYFGASLSQWIAWSYPLLQPLSRALLGFWLISLALSRQSATGGQSIMGVDKL